MLVVSSAMGTYPVRSVDREELLNDLPPSAYVLTDENLDAILAPVGPKRVCPPGEATKNLSEFGEALSWLAKAGASRRSTLVALGGGVIGDLAGFAASAYMRGIDYIQIPTTLLAMVDSSVGGKVGIDLPEGKNLAGAFLAPREVRLCIDLIETLPERQFINGMAEVLKYGFILDASLLAQLTANRLTAKSTELREVVLRCIQLKADVVAADEKETLGIRAALNFGHTIGHGLETVTGYHSLLHGEAISIGMVLEAKLGEELGITPLGTTEIVVDSMQKYGLPITHPALSDFEGILSAMYRDKKASGGRLAFSLLTDVGECKLFRDIEESAVRSVFASI